MSFREGPFNDLKVPLTWTAAVAVVVAIVVGVALLLSDRRETVQTQAYGVGRKVFDSADRPVAGVLAAPGGWARQLADYTQDYLFAASENRRLKQQVAELKGWRDTAIALKDMNARYRAILGLKTDPPIPMVTGRVVLDSRGPFANTRLADIGSAQGVKVGNPVMSEHGIIGRVVGVTDQASRVLLLTDVASRTPVLIDRTDARAILLGDGGSNPRLAFLRGQSPVGNGDRVLTSGDGGVFPRGLPVGVAARGLDGQWRVRLDADLTAIDLIRVLEFADFTALINEKQLDASAMPPLARGEALRALPPKPPPSSSAPASGAPPVSGSPVAPPKAGANTGTKASVASGPAQGAQKPGAKVSGVAAAPSVKPKPVAKGTAKPPVASAVGTQP